VTAYRKESFHRQESGTTILSEYLFYYKSLVCIIFAGLEVKSVFKVITGHWFQNCYQFVSTILRSATIQRSSISCFYTVLNYISFIVTFIGDFVSIIADG